MTLLLAIVRLRADNSHFLLYYEADEPERALIILHTRLEAAFSAGLCNLQRALSAGLGRGGEYCWDFC
jgi:hypothetical protein